jgi:hypothetical protein
MADTIQKYLDKDLYASAPYTDTNKIKPCFIYNDAGEVLTASGYVDPATIIGGVLEFEETNRVSPVIIVNADMEPLT